jgi:hypothetical protein
MEEGEGLASERMKGVGDEDTGIRRRVCSLLPS